MAPFDHVLTVPEQLREHYRRPMGGALAKQIDHLDEHCRTFIGTSPFVLIGTSGADGSCDVSPKGGDAGFVKVLDQHRLAIPDLNGNNRLDSLQNVVTNPHVGLLFLVPGMDETLRINGRAWVTVDPELLDSFTAIRRPASVLGVEVEEVYLHCAKSFRRSSMWSPDGWPDLSAMPAAACIFKDHGRADVAVDELETQLAKAYDEGLAADRP